jgi:NADPH:quinone reductase-like Zn-dependent oxidoreductase
MSERMRAVVVRRPGGPEVLEVAEIPRPRPGRGEVLVRVRAAGVNASDRHLRRSGLYLAALRALRGAAIAGLEFSGEVAELGPGVSDPPAGTAVWGALPGSRHGGSYAEYVVAQAQWLGPKPGSLSFEQAAAAPVGAMTALTMLRRAKVGAGSRVLIHGASGAIGTAAVQLARELGAQAIGVCSTANVELVKGLGAAAVIDYRRQSVRDAGQVDAVLDGAGLALADATALLRPGGAFVTAVFDFPLVARLKLRGFDASATMVEPRRALLDELRGYFERGVLQVPVDRVFPLEQAGAAQQHLAEGHPRGRVALSVA